MIEPTSLLLTIFLVLPIAVKQEDVLGDLLNQIFETIVAVITAIIHGIGAIITGIINMFWTPLDLISKAWYDSYSFFVSLGWGSPLALTVTAIVWGIIVAFGIIALLWIIQQVADWLG